jgi:O-antigen/teichoic acid export membrane protein
MLARGTLLMMGGQASFLLSSFVINFGLARLLGPVDYGTFGLVMSVLVVVELFVITGLPEVLQKYGGETPELMHLLRRKTFLWQLVYSGAVFACFWALTPLIVRSFNDEKLALLLRVASFDIIFYGLYKYYQGMQNGLHRFDRHALLGITYASSKVILILGLVLAGYSLLGAIVGNALASVAGLSVGIAVTRLPAKPGKLDEIPYLRFVVPNILYFVGLYLFFCIDLWFVKHFASDIEVGYYVSAGALSKVPYVLSIALSASLLPSLSRATKLRDEELVRKAVGESLRYLVIFLLLISVVVVSSSTSIVVLLFGSAYGPAAPALSILIAGISLITLFAVFNTVLMARNRMTTCFAMTFGLLFVDAAANMMLVPKLGIEGAAWATALTGLVGCVSAGYIVFREINMLLPGYSWLRIPSTALLVLGLSFFLPRLDSLVIIKCAMLSVLYFSLLTLFGELKSADFSRLRAALTKG